MLLVDFIIFVLSLWVGFEVISKVPATLHTPLMSAYVVTGRMLKMFRRRIAQPPAASAVQASPNGKAGA